MALRPEDDDLDYEENSFPSLEDDEPEPRKQARKQPVVEPRLFGFKPKTLYSIIIGVAALAVVGVVAWQILLPQYLAQQAPYPTQIPRVGMVDNQAQGHQQQPQVYMPPRQNAGNEIPPAPQAQLLPEAPKPAANVPSRNENVDALKSQLDIVVEKMDAMMTRIDELERRMSNGTVEPGNKALQEGLSKITGELQKAEVTNSALASENKTLATENSKLKEENSKLEKELTTANAELARSRQIIAQLEAKPKKKTEEKKKGKMDSPNQTAKADTVEHKDKPEDLVAQELPKTLNGVRIIGLWTSGAILSDKAGETATVEVGQSFKGIKVESVDFQNGIVKTDKGQLRYQ